MNNICSEKRASVYTLGCRLNQSETAIIAEKLVHAGFALVPFGEPADLAIINTCTVTQEADAKSRKAIRAFIRANPDAYVAVIGCYAELAHKLLATIEGIDLIVGHENKLDVLDYIAETPNGSPRIVHNAPSRDSFRVPVVGGARFTTRPMLKIQDGCDAMCSYCAVPFARGRARSREFDDLVKEAELLAEAGAKEIVIGGVNLGMYQYEGRGLLDVIDRINAITGIQRIRISSIEPATNLDGLFERMDDPAHALAPFLHVPVQSGSDAILSRMKRRYQRADFLALLEQAHSRVRDLCIGTDIMVGMPGEGESEFAETCNLLENSPINYAHVFKFSTRKGAAASRWQNKVLPQIMNQRSAKIRALSDVKWTEFLARHRGKVMTVLFEECVNGCWEGYTGNYIRVAACSTNDLANKLCPVMLDKPSGEILLGTLYENHH